MKTTETFSDQLLSALKPVLQRLQALAAHDPAVRAELRQLGALLLAFAEEPHAAAHPGENGVPTPTASITAEPSITAWTSASTSPAADAEQTEQRAAEERTTNPPPAASPEPAPASLSTTPFPAPPRLAPPTTKPSPSTRRSQPWLIQSTSQQSYTTDGLQQPLMTTALDLGALAQNCALKQEAATWAADRQRRFTQGNKGDLELELQRLKLIENAQSLTDCYLWMCQREAPAGVDPVAYEQLAGCFAATTQIIVLLDTIVANGEEDEPFLEPALNLAAEAQAALRNAIVAVNGTIDGDQVKLFQWLKAMTYYHQIHIREYMSKWNSAQPAAWAALKGRIQELADRIQEFKQLSRQRQKLFSKVRHRCRVIEGASGQERLEDWQRLVEAVSGLVDSGLPPSNIELRDYLLPILDQLPAALELPRNFQLVLREIDRFLATRAPAVEEFEATAPIEEVQRVRTLLRGQTVVLIGGERRQAAAAALSSAFDLKELIWIEGHDQTYTDFEPHVARPEVAVVLLAIRWSRHGFGEVKEFCLRYDKPLVRLLGGYNPNQVAYTILSQIGQRLLQPEN